MCETVGWLRNEFFFRLYQVNTANDTKVTTFGFKAEVQLPINEGDIKVDGIVQEKVIVLGGLIKHKLGSTSATGALYMKGMWYHAFGLDWLNIGNIYAA